MPSQVLTFYNLYANIALPHKGEPLTHPHTHQEKGVAIMPLKIRAHRHSGWDADVLHLDFSQALTTRTGTNSHYAPTPYEPDPADTLICQQVMKSLMSEDGGVITVTIQNGYRLIIKRSLAVSIDDIVKRVQAAVKRAGTTAVVVTD